MSRWPQGIARFLKRLYYDFPAQWLPGLVFPCRNVVLELTYRCNLTCDFCYLRVEEEKRGRVIEKKNELTYEEIGEIIRALPRRSNVTFVGGEVTIKDKFWDLVDLAARRHRVTIGTNAVLFTPQICDRIVRAGVRMIGTSIDGPEDVHDAIRGRGNFAKTCTNVRRILEGRREVKRDFPRINLNCVMIPENIPRLAEVIDVAHDVGFDSCSFQILDPSLSRSGINLRNDIVEAEPWAQNLPLVNREVFSASLDAVERRARTVGVSYNFVPLRTKAEVLDFYAGKFAYEDYTCSVPWTTTRISPTGDMFPCLNYRIGNLRQQSLNALWNSGPYREFRNRMKPRGLYQSCAGCCKMTPRKPHGS
jgi:MoaA/NifB/PqqE/SkfB family radical SAM enzyme